MSEEKPLRKRSEVGKPKTSETQQVFDRVAAQEKAVEAPVEQGAMEDISAFVLSLKKAGVSMSLIEAAQLGPEKRTNASRWLTTRNMAAVPEYLAKYFVTGEMAVTPSPKEFVAPTAPALAKAAQVATDSKKDHPEAWGGPPQHEVTIPVVSVSDDYNRLIETVLSEMDLDHEYEELEGFLEIGEDRRDYTTINDHVDKADRRAVRAAKLWAQAVIEDERLRLDQKEVDAVLWREASKKLAEEGSKSRIADVDAKIAEMFPDEWRTGRMRLKKSATTVELMKEFMSRWSARARSLQVMLSSCRK